MGKIGAYTSILIGLKPVMKNKKGLAETISVSYNGEQIPITRNGVR